MFVGRFDGAESLSSLQPILNTTVTSVSSSNADHVCVPSGDVPAPPFMDQSSNLANVNCNEKNV